MFTNIHWSPPPPPGVFKVILNTRAVHIYMHLHAVIHIKPTIQTGLASNLNMQVHAYTCKNTHTCTHTCMHIHTHILTRTHMRTHTLMRAHTHTHTHTHTDPGSPRWRSCCGRAWRSGSHTGRLAPCIAPTPSLRTARMSNYHAAAKTNNH